MKKEPLREFEISPLPKGHPDRPHNALYVVHRPDERAWAITHPEKGRMSSRGEWAPEDQVAGLTRWDARYYRFPFLVAMRTARAALGIPERRRSHAGPRPIRQSNEETK